MTEIFTTLINSLVLYLAKPMMELVNNNLFLKTFNNIFFIERQFSIDDTVIMSLNVIILSFAGSILTVKLLYKLICVYILKNEGEATTSPLDYLKNYAKGIVVSLTFTVAYQWLGIIMQELQVKLFDVIGSVDYSFDIDKATSNATIFLLVHVVFSAVVYINFLINGVRLLVLRLGIPFACVGLIDGEKGYFGVFMKKIFQTSATVLVQIVLVQLSVIPIMSGFTAMTALCSIAILAYSMKISTDLNEIFLANVSSGSGQKVSSAAMGIRTVVGLFKGGK